MRQIYPLSMLTGRKMPPKQNHPRRCTSLTQPLERDLSSALKAFSPSCRPQVPA